MKYVAIIFLLAINFHFVACENSGELQPLQPQPELPNNNVPIVTAPATNNDSIILVDASKDGGVWWYPQGGTYTAAQWHQGTALADMMRAHGFTVHELPRGTVITWNLLKNYKNVIRATAFFPYSHQELLAYDSFLNRSSALLLMNDHLQNSPNDALSARLGLFFSGSITGTISPVPGHVINNNVTHIPYIAGSVLLQPNPHTVTVLGYVNSGTETPGYAAMGIVDHPASKIFFIGDGNGLEQLPQPFTGNLFKWLFNL